ncbi:MAG: hypothetical protein K2Q01_07330 [Rickettsiales bacterium]|nr:hypothetical protein [Rickettsiales bacterium]
MADFSNMINLEQVRVALQQSGVVFQDAPKPPAMPPLTSEDTRDLEKEWKRASPLGGPLITDHMDTAQGAVLRALGDLDVDTLLEGAIANANNTPADIARIAQSSIAKATGRPEKELMILVKQTIQAQKEIVAEQQKLAEFETNQTARVTGVSDLIPSEGFDPMIAEAKKILGDSYTFSYGKGYTPNDFINETQDPVKQQQLRELLLKYGDKELTKRAGEMNNPLAAVAGGAAVAVNRTPADALGALMSTNTEAREALVAERRASGERVREMSKQVVAWNDITPSDRRVAVARELRADEIVRNNRVLNSGLQDYAVIDPKSKKVSARLSTGLVANDLVPQMTLGVVDPELTTVITNAPGRGARGGFTVSFQKEGKPVKVAERIVDAAATVRKQEQGKDTLNENDVVVKARWIDTIQLSDSPTLEQVVASSGAVLDVTGVQDSYSSLHIYGSPELLTGPKTEGTFYIRAAGSLGDPKAPMVISTPAEMLDGYPRFTITPQGAGRAAFDERPEVANDSLGITMGPAYSLVTKIELDESKNVSIMLTSESGKSVMLDVVKDYKPLFKNSEEFRKAVIEKQTELVQKDTGLSAEDARTLVMGRQNTKKATDTIKDMVGDFNNPSAVASRVVDARKAARDSVREVAEARAKEYAYVSEKMGRNFNPDDEKDRAFAEQLLGKDDTMKALRTTNDKATKAMVEFLDKNKGDLRSDYKEATKEQLKDLMDAAELLARGNAAKAFINTKLPEGKKLKIERLGAAPAAETGMALATADPTVLLTAPTFPQDVSGRGTRQM